MNRLAGAIGALALGCAPPAEPPFEPAERSKELLSAPHFAGDRFFNPWGAGDRSLLRGLRWQLTRSAYDKSGDPNVPVVSNDGAYLSDGSTSAPSVTWVGHATFAVHDGGDVFLTDPKRKFVELRKASSLNLVFPNIRNCKRVNFICRSNF